MVLVTLRAKRSSIFALCLIGLSAAVLWSRMEAPAYRVLSHDDRYSISAFKVSRGREHSLWDANPAELAFSRWLGARAWTRRIRSKLLPPASQFRAATSEPSLAFIVRLKGAMSDDEIAGLSARLVSGTNTSHLAGRAAQANYVRHSIMKCWAIESTPPTNAPLELRISFGSGAELARIAISTDLPEFQNPLVAPKDRKRHVADILTGFLEDKKNAEQTIMTLHELYEYTVPDYLTVFEMIYYDHFEPGAEKGRENLNSRLQAEARRWLSETTLR